jgi:hypothetical protein
MGNPWFDLAVVTAERAADADWTGALVTAYLGRPPGGEERQLLHEQGLIAAYLSLLWWASGQGGAVAADVLEQRMADLAARLDLSPENY